MIAEILCVGTELLMGQVLNTNAQFLSRRLSALGITNMWWGVFADVGVMILAVLNATRMLNVKEYQ